MTIAGAVAFHYHALRDDELRRGLNRATDRAARASLLAKRGIEFSPEEFDEAHRLAVCELQHASQHGPLEDFRLWWKMLDSFE